MMLRWTMRYLLLIALSTGCGTFSYPYEFEPENFAQDFGSQTGNLPDGDCTQAPSLCSTAASLVSGSTGTCDGATKKCVITYDFRQVQEIDLDKQASFPPQVLNSGLVSLVKIDQVRYWTPTNTLSFATPPIDVYFGPKGTQKESDVGAIKIATLDPLAAATPTACVMGQPVGDKKSACKMKLTDAGRNALSVFAKDFKTNFEALLVAHIVVHSGDAIPAGKLNLSVQPVVAFEITL